MALQLIATEMTPCSPNLRFSLRRFSSRLLCGPRLPEAEDPHRARRDRAVVVAAAMAAAAALVAVAPTVVAAVEAVHTEAASARTAQP